MRPVNITRTQRAIIATIAGVGWLAYMIVGLQLIDAIAPTVHGAGPEGLAAFIGLVSGVFVAGIIMWAASD